jgi:hypothetical protein
MNDIVFATWFSRILRWIMALGFSYLAYIYNGMEFLYIFSLVVFVTGFFTPKRCVAEQCNVPES